MTDVSIPPASQAENVPSQPEIAPVPSDPELPVTQIQTSAVQSGDQCASCGALLAADQRYCLECGQRRGDPRLPFMDAVVLMDAVQRPAQAPPPPPKKKRTGISPNAALIAGVGTLLLALGIGVLIGRSGSHEVASTASAPIVIRGGGGEESATASKAKTTTGGGTAANAKTKKQKAAALKAAEKHPAAEEVLKPTNGVKLAPPTTQPGDKCSDDTAGCENGEFSGNFFE
ncbi:MAG TPA: hypothetical protein VF085_04615 [Solirubrobacterales bacterium]